jgi:hypothetical protein
MALAPTDDMPTLRIHYETDGLMPAADVAAMLREVATGFDRFARQRRRYSGLRLAVRRVAVSSLDADLVVIGVGAATAALQHRQALYDFVGFIADTLSIAKGLMPGKVKAADAKMIDAVQKPVAEAGAQQVNLFVIGDGNTVNIDRDAIQLIRSHREQNLVSSTYEVQSPVEADLAGGSPPRLRRLEGKFGTVFEVHGQWYVRLEGEEGVLNPLELPPGVTVRDGQGYHFDGVWEGRRYRIRSAKPLL